MKKYLSAAKNGESLPLRVEDAHTFFTRMMGLMFRKSIPDDAALLICPCNQIHTFSMRFNIDAVYISEDNRVVKVEPDIGKRKVCKTVKDAHTTLELTSGTAKRLGIICGDELLFDKQ